jgi:Sensors of blue-light using FAD
MSSLIQCIYTSSATVDFREHDIPTLLESARLKNARLGVTGVLLYTSGTFFQVLEGESLDVSALYGAIVRDSRHARVREVLRRALLVRDFADWHMGFCNFERQDVVDLLGDRGSLHDDAWATRLDPYLAQRLLEVLRDGQHCTGYSGRFQSPMQPARWEWS